MYTCQDQCIHCHHHKVISLLYVLVKDRTPAHHRKLENNFSNFKFRAFFFKKNNYKHLLCNRLRHQHDTNCQLATANKTRNTREKSRTPLARNKLATLVARTPA